MKKLFLGAVLLLPVMGMSQGYLYSFGDTPASRAAYTQIFNTSTTTQSSYTPSSYTPPITQKQYDPPVVLQTSSGELRVLNLDDNPRYPYFTPLTPDESYLKSNYQYDKSQREIGQRLEEIREENRQRQIIREELHRANIYR